MTEPVRLARRLADMLGCSRRQAELYVEGGWVRVDGVVNEAPQFKVVDQTITLDPQARAEPVLPATVLLHKPADYDWDQGARPACSLLLPGKRWDRDRHSITRPLQRHLQGQTCVTPLETGASGLLVFTQDPRIRRKLTEAAAQVEHEAIVDVTGEVTEAALRQLNRAPVVEGRAMLPAKVSISSQVDGVTGLRFAVKGSLPGQIAQMCGAVQLTVVGIRRIRVGRIALAALPLGQWRYLMPYERI
ncbi:MAG: RNA pseudouridine synthase [Burkholderiaceae bacterium]